MRIPTTCNCGLAGLGLVAALAVTGRAQERGPARPLEPIAAIADAFRTHDLVAISDPHGSAEMQTLLRALVRDRRINEVVQDLVVEIGNSRYQDLVDRYVQGGPVSLDDLRPAWQDTTVPNQVWADDELFSTVRALNTGREPERRLRILLGDPPIDWTQVRTRDDHFRWLAMRDSYPAALVQLDVLARRHKALIVYGHMHFQRRNIMSNLDMSDWRAQTLVSLIEQAGPSKVFSIWRLDGPVPGMPSGAAGWPAPSLAIVRGTQVGAADIAVLPPVRTRMAVQNGALVPVPKDQWRALAIEEQLDALLYLGPPEDLHEVAVPPRACTGPSFLEERLRRIALTGIPAFEADRVRQLCAAR